MAKPPPDPPSTPDDDDVAVADAPTAQPTAASSASTALTTTAGNDVEVIFRSKIRRADIVKNVIVGVVLSAAVGWFLFSITIERPWYGLVVGVLLALSGARGRVEKDELAPIEVIPALERKRAVELHFESKPTMLIDSRTARFVDAEATGNSREGYTHWVVVRREGERNIRLRVPSRAEAIRISKRLRVILEVPPVEPLGEDELEGDDYPPREAE
jgi:F0F1-type ATP synthase assembly protein I